MFLNVASALKHKFQTQGVGFSKNRVAIKTMLYSGLRFLNFTTTPPFNLASRCYFLNFAVRLQSNFVFPESASKSASNPASNEIPFMPPGHKVGRGAVAAEYLRFATVQIFKTISAP